MIRKGAGSSTSVTDEIGRCSRNGDEGYDGEK